MKRPHSAQRGAALLVAMVVLTLVGTLAAGMIWQQSRALGVESAERTRAQAGWILTGALDLGRLLLRLDARTPGVDHLNELWATQLEEASLSSMLAQDRQNNADGAPEAFLRGSIRDAQGRYNLRNLVDPATQKIVPAELEALQRLCELASVGPDSAQRLAGGLQRAWQVRKSGEDESGDAVGAMLAPQTLDQLVWLGLDADSVGRLRPFVDLLPEPTPLNINTATPEVLAAVVAGLDVASAKRVESKRPYRRLQDASSDITIAGALDPKRLSVGSSYFVISGRLRMEGRVLEERMLVRRDNREVVQVARWRQSLQPNDE